MLADIGGRRGLSCQGLFTGGNLGSGHFDSYPSNLLAYYLRSLVAMISYKRRMIWQRLLMTVIKKNKVLRIILQSSFYFLLTKPGRTIH